MDEAALNAITDTDALRALVREQMARIAPQQEVIVQRELTIARRDHEIACKTAKIDKLTHELARLRRVQFSARSERMNPVQRELFDEAMAADIAAVEAELEALQDCASAPSARPPRAKPVSRPLSPELPREITVHTPEQCDCATCGTALTRNGTHASEKLAVKPPVFFVRRDEYPQRACPQCKTTVAEPVAPALIDGGQTAPGLLAQAVIQKYADHLPLYRQEAIFARHGITLSRSTLAEWLGHVGRRLQPLVDALRAKLLTVEVLHADEPLVAQLDPGAGKTKRAYLFAYAGHGGPSGASAGGAGAARRPDPPPIVIFDYCPTRAGRHAADFLGPWQGALMVDDHGGYEALFAHGITELGCWAHARRKFFDAHQAGYEGAGRRAAAIMSLFVTAKVNGIDPHARLSDVLTRLPTTKDRDIECLLPLA
ncbi:MAG: IS66 family transposase [Proteobacteria bacterium]|nr:IS66 family transposase [Pseudomonadota bacterium]